MVTATGTIDDQLIALAWFSIAVIHVLFHNLSIRTVNPHHYILDKYRPFASIIDQMDRCIRALLLNLNIHKLF